MERKNELKEIDIENRTCYYVDDIKRFRDRDVNFSDFLLDGKLYKEKYEIILIHDVSHKTSKGAKLLLIRFDKIDGFIKNHNGIKYLILFDCS